MVINNGPGNTTSGTFIVFSNFTDMQITRPQAIYRTRSIIRLARDSDAS